MADVKLAPVKPPVSLADLEKLDIRVGTIRAVEDIPASAKLVRLRVDFGDHSRTILAGLRGERAKPQVGCHWAGAAASGRAPGSGLVNTRPTAAFCEIIRGMRGRLGRRDVLPLLLLAALSGSCDYIQDRFRSCGHLRVDLINDPQAGSSVYILVEGESPTLDRLLASGASRQLVLCVELGDRKRFRVIRDGDPVAVANCVVSKARYEYETSIARVIWYPSGLACENW